MVASDIEDAKEGFMSNTLYALLAAIAWCGPLILLVLFMVSGSYAVEVNI